MRVYISGPITGTTDYGWRFADAADVLTKTGHTVVNPVHIGTALKYKLGREPTWHEYMREGIKALMDCDAICMLDGWNRSKGSRVEKELAEELEIKEITLERNDNGNKKSL